MALEFLEKNVKEWEDKHGKPSRGGERAGQQGVELCDSRSNGGPSGITPRYLLGRLASGSEGGKGVLVHAVQNDRYDALCGAEPGPRSAGWKEYLPSDSIPAVTCKRCLSKIEK